MNKLLKFTVIPDDIIEDKSLSTNARFLYILISSKAIGHEFINKELCEDLGCSKDSLLKYSKELETAGYISKTQIVDGKNQFSGNVYEILKPAS